ncbi:hypothetical protein C1646_772698 [Rhizophagus diaphanus]|nr:hypothetical protein C1646_772698 [Rhizophagus diaphanus] [Rhizophagus sp. MUCL 43196]
MKLISHEGKFKDSDVLNIWKINIKKYNLNPISTEDDIEKLGGELMESKQSFVNYFQMYLMLRMLTSTLLLSSQTSQTQTQLLEILRKADSHWTKLKDKLVKKIELETFRVTNHIYEEEDINASGIPVINNRLLFILHSLLNNPENNDHEDYLQKEMLTALLNNVMKIIFSSCWALPGTRMSFDDITNQNAFAVAKSCSVTFKNFFSIHDGFYKYDEMMSQNNMNQIVNNWQARAKNSIIESFMESCFLCLCEKNEAWNKMLDIMILSIFSLDNKDKLFNAKSYKKHDLFANIENIDKLDLLSYEATIRNFDDCNSFIFSSNGTIKGFNLHAFLNNPPTAFLMLEKEAGPDLVCIVEFHTSNGIVKIHMGAFLE